MPSTRLRSTTRRRYRSSSSAREGVPRGGYPTDRTTSLPASDSPGSRRLAHHGDSHGLRPALQLLADGDRAGAFTSNPPFFNAVVLSLADGADPDPRSWPTGGAAPLPPSALTYDPNLTSSYAQNWNFSVQQEISGEVVLTASYVGTRGVHLLGSRDINQPMPSPQQPNLRPLPFFSRHQPDRIVVRFRLPQPATGGAVPLRGRPDGVVQLHLVALHRQRVELLPVLEATRTSRRTAMTPRPSAAARLRRPAPLRGSFAYDLPVGRNLNGAAKHVLAGWRLNGVVTLQSGQPYTVALPGRLDNSTKPSNT